MVTVCAIGTGTSSVLAQAQAADIAVQAEISRLAGSGSVIVQDSVAYVRKTIKGAAIIRISPNPNPNWPDFEEY
jgi:hypothetical protein